MIKRVLAGLFGAVIFTFLVPFLYVVLLDVPDPESVLLWLAGGGAAMGAILGALLPGVFGAVFTAFLADL